MVQTGKGRGCAASALNARLQNIAMSKTYKKSISLLFLVLLAASCNSQERQEPSAPTPKIQDNGQVTPEAIVKAFCAFDAKGKRFFRSLSEQEHSYYRSLVHWKQDRDWNKAVMISSYKVGKIMQLQDTGEIIVTYQVKGKYSPDVTDIYEKEEKIKYRLAKTETGWKIQGPVTPPHVYPEKLIMNLEKRSKIESDAAKKVKFQNDANLIKNLKYFNVGEKGSLF
jgi:hypothetical protein